MNKKYIYTVCAITSMGGILFGFDLVTISGTIPLLRDHFKLSDAETGWAVGCINLGCALGAIISGKMSSKYGRKKVLISCALLFAITGIGIGWASTFIWFIIFRLLCGIAVGAAALCCPIFIAEITPANIRGRMVSFYQLAITFGILLAYLSNYLLLNTGINNWRWMFSMQSVPGLLFLAGLFFVDESPRWLAAKGYDSGALNTLAKVGGFAFAQRELLNIKESLSNDSNSSYKLLLSKSMRLFVLIGVMVAIFSQASGINSLFSYAPEILSQSGIAKNSAFLQSTLLGIVCFIFTFIAILSIDKTGRRNLLLTGSLLLFLDCVFLAIAVYFNLKGIYVFAGILIFIAIFCATLGPVLWVLLSEIFPNKIRDAAMSVATLSVWTSNFFTITLFPVMKANFGLGGTFLIHAGICLMYFLFIKIWIPETNGQTLENIERNISSSIALK